MLVINYILFFWFSLFHLSLDNIKQKDLQEKNLNKKTQKYKKQTSVSQNIKKIQVCISSKYHSLIRKITLIFLGYAE